MAGVSVNTFPPEMFPGTAIFYASGVATDQHGAALLGSTGTIIYAPTNPGGSVPWGGGGVYVDPDTRTQGRDENHYVPEGRLRQFVYTATNPGAGVDWLVSWNGRLLRVTASPATCDGWALWRTECTEVI